jgi:hypothetical protein
MSRNLPATTARQGAVVAAPSIPPMPRLSPLLDSVVRDVTEGTAGAPVWVPPRLQPILAAEAKRAADVIERRLNPATWEDWKDFLLPLVATVEFSPSKADFAAALTTFAENLDVPAHLLTASRRRQAVAHFQKFPTGPSLLAFFGPAAREEREQLRALRQVASRSEAGPEQYVASEEAKAAVRAKAQAFRNEVAARERRAEPEVQRKPLHLTPAQELAAMREVADRNPGREGDAARFRVRQLEEGA